MSAEVVLVDTSLYAQVKVQPKVNRILACKLQGLTPFTCMYPQVLGQLRHKSIMSLYDWWYDPQGLLIFVTELFVDGTLRQ